MLSSAGDIIRHRIEGRPQARKLRIQVSQRCFEHFPVTGILGSPQLLDDPLPRQQDSLPLTLQSELFQALPRFLLSAIRQRFCLLLFDGLALPASGHRELLYEALACRGAAAEQVTQRTKTQANQRRAIFPK